MTNSICHYIAYTLLLSQYMLSRQCVSYTTWMTVKLAASLKETRMECISHHNIMDEL
jgi:hypothetical protein